MNRGNNGDLIDFHQAIMACTSQLTHASVGLTVYIIISVLTILTDLIDLTTMYIYASLWIPK